MGIFVGPISSSASAWTPTSQSTTYSAAMNDYVIASGSSFTITLPTAVGVGGQKIAVEHAGTALTQIYTIHTTSSQTVTNAGTTYSNTDVNTTGLVKLVTTGEVLVFMSDGSNWRVIEHKWSNLWTNAGAVGITATTTNPTKGTATIVTDEIRWRRNAQNAIVKMIFYKSATGNATAGSGQYLFGMPSNMSIDTTALVADNSVYNGAVATFRSNIVGSGFLVDNNSSADAGPAYVSVYDANNVTLQGVNVSNTGSGSIRIAGSGSMSLTTSAGINYGLYFEVPISGWMA